MQVYFTFEPREDLRKPLVAEFPEVNFVFDAKLREEQLAEAEIVFTYGEDLTTENIALANKLQWIFVASAGVEKMPAQAIAERDIAVSNVRGIHKRPMTESVLAHILALKRGLPFIYEQQKKGEWNKKTSLSELNGSTALIIGPGAIGAEIGRILQAFGVHTIGCNRSGQPVESMGETHMIKDLHEHLPKADIVISMLPSTEETKHLLTYEHFELMKDTAIFMNFGRGNVVKEDELVRALKNKLIGHAVLDVFEVEPLPANSELWKLDNVTVSPHFSSHSSRYVERALEIFKPSLKKWLNGERDLENKMDLLRGY
ncbi:D-2-hydroxyacid dehydrogenase [Lysinibacillus louembei]|uniref:D-2-hydroxyacid dehydrogenase n=1 Tax=Lysinibacillus louembei TaxID=1470088 RepID=A0ABZ0S2C5_9BACI|nr:D-2-hydroxyacid dehydrogenase [Lysinibacillus louembei]WPK13811.1 D-2-hydroxyacid dehydrogenase [Lysinibacillus louembei]